MIELYGDATGNAIRVAIALEEVGLMRRGGRGGCETLTKPWSTRYSGKRGIA
jgi:hypothetical protein